MELKEVYQALGGDYESAIGRLRNETILRKFVLKFLNDQSYHLLLQSTEAKDAEMAFRAAHTLKGVCQNLSFDKLYISSERMTEALRQGWTPDAEALLSAVRGDYHQTVDAIRQLDGYEG